MTELHKDEAVEAEYTEVAEQAPENEAPKVSAQIVISIMENGQLDVSTPEGAPELKPFEIEGVTRQVSDQLRDIRVANSAVEIFKQRLG